MEWDTVGQTTVMGKGGNLFIRSLLKNQGQSWCRKFWLRLRNECGSVSEGMRDTMREDGIDQMKRHIGYATE